MCYVIIVSGVPSTRAARGDDLKCRPVRKRFFGPAQKVNQLAKISDDLLLVIHHKNENFTVYELC